MTDIEALIARLEAATEGSAELSALIARDVLGHVPHDWPVWFRGPSFDGRDDAIVPVVPYTTSVDAALTLVPEGWSWQVSNRGSTLKGHGGRAYLTNREPHTVGLYGASNPAFRYSEETAATPPLALCIACLKARSEIPRGTGDGE